MFLPFLLLASSGGCGGADTRAQDDDDGDGWIAAEDCADWDAERHPGATEHCDGADEDCDGLVDEDPVDAPAAYHVDEDGDSFGFRDAAPVMCDPPDEFVQNGDDCDDFDELVHPGASEVCDGADNDCDGDVDEEACEDTGAR